jgi:hypothetical protein
MALQIINEVDNIRTTAEQWWVIYNADTKIVAGDPMQCVSYVASPHVMLVADTEEEILAYIEENDLIIPNEEYEEHQL